MRGILFEFELHPTTWVYISSLMVIGIYFKFHRLWSVRNLDLLGLLAFAPGLLLVTHDQERLGYVWLFAISGFFLVRLLLDPIMVRRPLLEPNLSASGLTFTGVCLLLFLFTRVLTANVEPEDKAGVQRLEQIMARQESDAGKKEQEEYAQHGPGYPLFYLFARFADRAFVTDAAADTEEAREAQVEARTAKITAILALLALVLGMVLIGYRHFDNIHAGVAVASLYLLLPYAAQIPSRVDHILPAALLVWAVAAYRRPIAAGILLGLAAGVVYYPLFLLPLWCSFYWRRGCSASASAAVCTLLVLVATLAFDAGSWDTFADRLQLMFGWMNPQEADFRGFWAYYEPAFRIPVVVAFVAHVRRDGALAAAEEPGHAA